MTGDNIDFSNPTRIFGNDVASLIETYATEIMKMGPSSRGAITVEQIKTIFIAYVSARNSAVFSSFKDRQLGISLWRLFMEELSELSLSTGDVDAVSKLTEVFHKQINVSPRDFDEYFFGIYRGASKNTATSDEMIWVKNFINAIRKIDMNYNAAAEKYGFF